MNNLNNAVGLDEDDFPTSSLDTKRLNQFTIYYPEENFTFPESTDWKQFIVNSLKNSNGYIRMKIKIVYLLLVHNRSVQLGNIGSRGSFL